MTSLVKIFALKKEGDPYTWSYRAPIIDGLKNKWNNSRIISALYMEHYGCCWWFRNTKAKPWLWMVLKKTMYNPGISTTFPSTGFLAGFLNHQRWPGLPVMQTSSFSVRQKLLYIRRKFVETSTCPTNVLNRKSPNQNLCWTLDILASCSAIKRDFQTPPKNHRFSVFISTWSKRKGVAS